MDIMLESKDDRGITHFVLGCIVFSGSMELLQGADPANPRGSQCLVCGSLRAYRADAKGQSPHVYLPPSPCLSIGSPLLLV